MSEAHRKKKNPDQVRADLLASARALAVEQGILAVSVQAVSTMAGVTKGAFFNHFETKQALVDALIHELMESMDVEIDRLMSLDSEPHGRFTRAYVETTFANPNEQGDWSPLWMSMVADRHLRANWSAWFASRLIRHQDTDVGIQLEAVRFTADGYWLGQIVGVQPENREALREHLVRLTRKQPQDPPAQLGKNEDTPA